ncbi:trypsin inhibitor DE-3-like [Abrus precatorius]|uniref:Trypsin inhibitor DE-3-like n=1 Tax=Abrus precatorius TaxID=3816 RepID=A0A8B8JV68_ABRPR|nr:trypsin inhibitor DE-3-like [Abrus precatorius]
MKGTTMFALFLFSSALFSYLPWATADFVLDIDGNPIVNGAAYHILPAIWAVGGGIAYAKTGNETCPLTVVVENSEVDPGLPIKISSPALIAFITTDLRLELAFTTVPKCAPTPSKWTVVEGLPQGPAVKLTGYDHTVRGSFNIEKSGFSFAYKLRFCAADTDTCVHIGLHVLDFHKTLVVTEDYPLDVVFRKANHVDA